MSSSDGGGDPSSDLTPGQREIKKALPGTTPQIADVIESDLSVGAIRAKLNRMKPLVSKDEDNVWFWAAPEEGDDPEDLTDREAYILRELPAGTAELADDLNISEAVAEAHLATIDEKGWQLDYDENAECWYTDGETKRRIGSRHMATITRKANNWLTAAEDDLIRRLRTIEPTPVDVHTEPDNEDVVAVLSDVHIGQDVEDENGNLIYGEPEWRGAIQWFGRKCLSIPQRMSGSLDNFDTFYLVLNGDEITNENIYKHQPEDVGAYIAEQIDIATEELISVIVDLAEHFDTLRIICQVGNHGEMRASGQTRQANADLFVYRNLKRAMYFSPYDNIEFQVGDATPYKTFTLRDGRWHALATHGEAAYSQITGTSASDSQMQNWRAAFDPPLDLFYLSHYHDYREAPVNGVPAFRTPSAKPGGIYEFEIGQLEASNTIPKVGMIHGVSDDRPVTWRMPIDLVGSGVFTEETYPALRK